MAPVVDRSRSSYKEDAQELGSGLLNKGSGRRHCPDGDWPAPTIHVISIGDFFATSILPLCIERRVLETMQGLAALNDTDCRHMVVLPAHRAERSSNSSGGSCFQGDHLDRQQLRGESKLPQDVMVPLGAEHWQDVKTGLWRELWLSAASHPQGMEL